MNFSFKVVRRTVCIDEHTVHIDAKNEDSARKKILSGGGEYLSPDRDEIKEAKILLVEAK